jgi:hypothetical protein
MVKRVHIKIFGIRLNYIPGKWLIIGKADHFVESILLDIMTAKPAKNNYPHVEIAFKNN